MTSRFWHWNLPPKEFARRETLARLERVLAELERISSECGEDEVHDLRVSIRRYAQAVRVFSTLLPRKARRIAQRLKGLLDAAAPVRDIDVGLKRLSKLGVPADDALPAAMREQRRREALSLQARVFDLRSRAPELKWPAVFGETVEGGAA